VSKQFHTGSHDLPVTPQLEEFMRDGWLDSSLDPSGAGRRVHSGAAQALHQAFPASG
jgi:hypothetical protein